MDSYKPRRKLISWDDFTATTSINELAVLPVVMVITLFMQSFWVTVVGIFIIGIFFVKKVKNGIKKDVPLLHTILVLTLSLVIFTFLAVIIYKLSAVIRESGF